jgi:hypothetical protein
MSETKSVTAKKYPLALSLDAWAVIVSLVAALLIRAGIISRIPW